jgi:hypothetical protein
VTEHNHRRGTRGRGHGCRYGSLPAHCAEFWQRRAHRKRRMLVGRLVHGERYDDIPENTPKHVRWDYW